MHVLNIYNTLNQANEEYMQSILSDYLWNFTKEIYHNTRLKKYSQQIFKRSISYRP